MRNILLVFAIFCTASLSPAATYYIDYASGSDANSGTSQSGAWQKCPGMVGFTGAYSHAPGDVFIFKGGATWPASGLPLTLAYSGSAGNVDTYTTDHAWYSGTTWTQPTMDGQLKGRAILLGVNKGYFKINDIAFINAGSLSANSVKGVELSDCDNIELCNNTFAPESWGCLYLWTSKAKNFNNYLIHHNDISKCAFGMRIVPSGASSIINNVQIYNNKLHDFHSQLSGQVHGDGIQHYVSPDANASYDRYINGFQIFNNSFTGDFTQVSGGSGAMTALIYLSSPSKGVEIYNNVFAPVTSGAQSPNFFESFISLRDNPNRGGFHKIYDNTFVTQVPDGQVAAILEDDPSLPSPNLDVRNNIFSGFKCPFDLVSPNHSFDYNDLNFTKNVGKWMGSWVTTFADWQKLGNDIHGMSVDPRFVSSSDFHLRTDSPCKDHGAMLSEPFSIDINGEPRPQGPTFDLGAFETPEPNAAVKDAPSNFSPAPPAGHAPASPSGGDTRMFDITGKLIQSGKNGQTAHARLLVTVSKSKQAYVVPVVKR